MENITITVNNMKWTFKPFLLKRLNKYTYKCTAMGLKTGTLPNDVIKQLKQNLKELTYGEEI